jgi:hypothetical protein
MAKTYKPRLRIIRYLSTNFTFLKPAHPAISARAFGKFRFFAENGVAEWISIS